MVRGSTFRSSGSGVSLDMLRSSSVARADPGPSTLVDSVGSEPGRHEAGGGDGGPGVLSPEPDLAGTLGGRCRRPGRVGADSWGVSKAQESVAV
ncbi:hypothetical protein GCM10009740_36080 [Terrabacter terrae]|uniref:Uncharacterized protein n=1 Tax=Terrabacter terrae TaxID=318434 RepID=A0ABN2UMF8_9MICO